MNETTNKLIKWYHLNKRNLPWREVKDPYLIWISEIILQQTRVDQGIGYYYRFIKRFPDVQKLASASEQEVLNIWQGLGYYSRARNLHYTAQEIMHKYDGMIPGNYKDLISQKGIGDYTAAAILSFAFNKPYVVVDGNVIRVLSRMYGISTPMNTSDGRNKIRKIAESLIPVDQPGVFNQSIMEFGALYCKPQIPDCAKCLFSKECIAYHLNKVKKIPVTGKQMEPKIRYFNYLVLYTVKNGRIHLLVRKRNLQDIWKNLYDFPLVEADNFIDPAILLDHIIQYNHHLDVNPDKRNQELLTNLSQLNLKQLQHQIRYVASEECKHKLTHQIIHARFFTYRIMGEVPQINESQLKLVKLNDLADFPIPRLIEKFLENQLFEKKIEKN